MLLVHVYSSFENSQDMDPTFFEIDADDKIFELKQKLEPVLALPLSQINIYTSEERISDKEVISDVLRAQNMKNSGTVAVFHVFQGNTCVANLNFHQQLHTEGNPQESQYILTLDSCCSSSSAVSGLLKDRSPTYKLAAGDSTRSVILHNNRPRFGILAEADGLKCESTSSTEEEQPSCSSSVANPQCIDRTKDCCQQQNCGKPDNRPPYARTMPENRRFGLVVSNLDCCADVDSEAVMAHIFNLFESCSITELRFSDCISMAKFGSNLLMVCVDDQTANWVISAVDTLCPPHSCLPFIKFFDLLRCSFVLPLVRPGEPLCSIFALMEKQNLELVTDKWSVISRIPVDPCDPDLVTDLCPNEMIELYIDEDSRDLISEQCEKIVYFCWHLKVNFEC
ncbi:uncharacterized protein LOC119563204 isoform X2 [Drosophila subpulchrella]|uniref:uncharacterized protein LOC119563204 isoform X2 n=1 Tax=Drosophila subpulchrella TaxID=1486046 RepID=UPI0018A1734E|nr:uncharacterized protein LOC119563204 isoform X2 [Drosophila subpulchrella]XP_037732426.1 uncharacterized protein LOC119563204 isoform X2 [Drosophila subpulchrella]